MKHQFLFISFYLALRPPSKLAGHHILSDRGKQCPYQLASGEHEGTLDWGLGWGVASSIDVGDSQS